MSADRSTSAGSRETPGRRPRRLLPFSGLPERTRTLVRRHPRALERGPDRRKSTLARSRALTRPFVCAQSVEVLIETGGQSRVAQVGGPLLSLDVKGSKLTSEVILNRAGQGQIGASFPTCRQVFRLLVGHDSSRRS